MAALIGNLSRRQADSVIDNKSRFLSNHPGCHHPGRFLSSAFAATKLQVAFTRFLTLRPVTFTSHRFCGRPDFPFILLSLVLGELVPKRLAHAKAGVLGLYPRGVFLRFFDILFYPFTRLLELSSNAVIRLFGIDPGEVADQVTEEEIRILVEAGAGRGDLEEEEANLIKNIFAFDDKYASEIMTPRVSLTAIPLTSSYEEAVAIAADARYSRFPVYDEDIDDIVGVLTVKDLLRAARDREGNEFNLRQILHPPYFIPEGKKIDVLFKEMQKRQLTMAVVVDEYGGTEGIVTLEDLLEEIVGEIEDEYDPARGQCYDQSGRILHLSADLSRRLRPAAMYRSSMSSKRMTTSTPSRALSFLSWATFLKRENNAQAVFNHMRFTRCLK